MKKKKKYSSTIQNATIQYVRTSLPFVINHPRKENKNYTYTTKNFILWVSVHTFANCGPYYEQGEKT